MENADKRSRIRGFILASVCILLFINVVAVAVVLTPTLRQDTEDFKRTFIARCEEFEGNDCQNIWDVFEQAYVGKDPCDVPMEAYDPFVAAVTFTPACNRMMFWSKTKEVVNDFTKKRDCFVTLELTMLGHLVDDQTWCGKVGSDKTFTTGCPEWSDCANNPVSSFWNRTSAAYGDAACGDVTTMLNGSLAVPYNPLSYFASVEVKRFNSSRVRSLKAALVAKGNFVSDCSNESLKNLQKEMLDKGIRYSCKEVPETQMLECASNPEKPCGACL